MIVAITNQSKWDYLLAIILIRKTTMMTELYFIAQEGD